MTNDEILKKYRDESARLRRTADILNGSGLLEAGDGIAKYQKLLGPEAYTRMRTVIDAAPDYARRDIEEQYEQRILTNLIFPNMDGGRVKSLARVLAGTVADAWKTPQKATDFIRDSWNMGLVENHLGNLWNEIRNQGGAPTEAQQKRLDTLEGERYKLSKSATNNWLARSAGQAATSVAMTWQGTAQALAGSAASAVIGAKIGAAAGTLAAPGAGTAAGAGAGALIAGSGALAGLLSQAYLNQKVYRGQSYERMRKAGIDHDIADFWSSADAAGMVTLESLLSAVIPEGVLARSISTALAGNLAKKNITAAVVRQAAAELGKDLLMGTIDAGMEGVEEVTQTVWSNLSAEWAAMRQEERYGYADWDAIDANKEDAGEAFKGGISMALWLGIIPGGHALIKNGVNVKRAFQISKDVKTILALNPGYQTRKEALTEAYGGEDGVLSDDNIEELAAEGATDDELAKFRTFGPVPREGNPAKFNTGKDGIIAGRVGKSEFQFRDPQGMPYGVAKYEVTGEDTLNITSLEVTNKNITNPDELQAAVIRTLGKSFPDYNITLNATANKDTEAANTANRILEAGTRELYAEREAAGARAAAEALNKLWGGGLAKQMGLEGKVEVVTDRANLSAGEAAEVDKAPRTVKGVTFWKGPGQKTRIYINGKNAGPDTIAHELIHAYRLNAAADMKKRMSDALGIADTDGAWNTASFKSRDGEDVTAHEKLAEYWEDYLAKKRDGIPAAIKEFFYRLAEAIYEIFKGMGWKGQDIPAELRGIFDEITEGRAQIAPQTREEGRGSTQTEKTGNDTASAGKTLQGALDEENARVLYSLGDDEKPAPEQIAEARRQYEEVAARYTKPDGTHTEGWMKAPNGKKTKLTERQWVQVRTQLFKDNYFGDWETLANAEKLLADKAVTSITGKEFEKDPNKDLLTQVQEYFDSMGGKVTRDSVGTVLLEKSGVKSSIAHGLGREKAAAFKAVPDIIRHGTTIDRQANWKGRGYDTEVIDAVIDIGGTDYIAEVIINKHANGRNTYYLHEVEEKTKLRAKTGVDTGVPEASKLIIGQKLDSVKGEVSAVRDAETGEPLVVYHGTHAKFDVFDRNKGDLNDAGWSGEGHYFYEDLSEASQYAQREGGHIMEVFLNVRDPYYLSVEERNELAERDDRDYSIEFTDELKGEGYDGVYYNGDLRKEWTVFKPNQIKSATGNAGTFSGGTNHVLYSLGDDEKPAPEQIAEARRQYEEVAARYTKPDGTHTEGWMKAPNGKKTKLTERQWVQVRTPLFKAYFGDWEALEELIADTNLTKAQVLERLKEIAKTDLINLSTGIKAQINTKQRNKLVSNAARDKSMQNGFTAQEHNAAAAIIDKLWKHAEQVESRPDKDGDKNIVSIKRFAAPIVFSNGMGIAYMTVKESVRDGHRIYSVELQEIKKPRSKGNTLDQQRATTGVSQEIIDRLLKKVNPSDVSVVRDAETREPLVVYHYGSFDGAKDLPKEGMHFGTEQAAIDRAKTAHGDKTAEGLKVYQEGGGWVYEIEGYWKSDEVYATEAEAREDAQSDLEEILMDEGRGMMDVEPEELNITAAFLNIRNPKTETDRGAGWSEAVEKAKREGYDGIKYVNKYEDPGSRSWIALNEGTVKDAEYNAGTFSGETNNILFSLGNTKADGAVKAAETADNEGMNSENRRRAEHIEELKNAPNIRLKADGYKGKYEITGDPKTDKVSIENYLETLKDKEFHNAGIEVPVRISARSREKITSFGMSNNLYKKLIAHIPELIEKSTYIADTAPRKALHHYSLYKELVAGVEFEESGKTEPLVVRSVLGVENGIAYYSFFVSKIDKSGLLSAVQGPNSVSATSPTFSNIKDEALLEILRPSPQDLTARITSPPPSQVGYDITADADKRLSTPNPDTSLSDTTENLSTPLDDDPAIQALFQLTREGELAEARKAADTGKSRDEFIDDQLAYSAMMDEELPDDIQDEAEAREWLGKIYDEAANKGDGRYTSTEIDEMLAEEWRADAGKFKNFMELAGATLSNTPGDDNEAALRRELELVSAKGEHSGGYTLFENTARSAYNGKAIKDQTRKSLVTYMTHDMGRFRDLYIRLTGDKKYRDLSENEIYEDYETGIQDRGRMSAYEVGRAKEKIRDKALREKIDAGTATDADYQRVIEEAGRRAKEQEAEATRLETELGEKKEKLSESETESARRGRLLRETEERAAAEIEAADKDYTDVIRTQERDNKRLQGKIEKREALLDELKNTYAERDAARRLLADKRRQLETALKPPGDSVDIKKAQEIIALQAGFSGDLSTGRTPAKVSVPGYDKPMTVDEFREKTKAGEIKYDTLPGRLQKIYDKKGLNEMDLNDIKAFKEEINLLKTEGRIILRERLEKERALGKLRIARVLDAMKKAYEDPKARGAAKRLNDYLTAHSPEERKAIQQKTDAAGALHKWLEIDRLLEVTGMDYLKNMIIEGRDAANYAEGQNVNRRYEGLSRLLGETEKERNRRITELGAEVIPIEGAFHNGRDWKFSKAFLMTASVGLDNARMRIYLLYGHLMSSAERSAMKADLDAAKGDKEKTAAVKARYEAAAQKKEDAVRAAIKEHLTGEDLVIRDYIRDDFIENFERINEAAYKVDNILMTKVLSYLPIYGKGAGHEAEMSVNGMKVTATPEKGFEIDRKNIPEYAVTDIETDFFKLFYRGVENQEHFAAFAPFIKGMNAVFHGKDPRSRDMRNNLLAMHGKRFMEVIDDYLQVMANPKAVYTGDDAGMALVGKAAVGYITWNILPGIKQVPQSVVPFLLKVKPEYLLGSMAKYMGSIGPFNGRKYNAMKEGHFRRSSDLRRRVRNIEAEYAAGLKALADNPVKKGATGLAEAGLFLQKAADEFACVAGWDAAYNEKTTELLREGKLDAAARERKAVIHADSVLAQTQPTTNPLYMSMGFRKFPKIMKFFSMPLSKMFNMAAGIPAQIRRGEGAYVARYIAGTVIVGIALALLQRKLFDDDDEPEDLLKKMAFYGVAEPALAHIPLAALSTSFSWIAARALLEDKNPAPQRDFLPLPSIVEGTVTDIGNRKWDRVLRDAMRFAGYMYALPTTQTERIIKAVAEKDPYAAIAGGK